MNAKKNSIILYTILITICLTIAVQVYWNYKNYLLNKQHFINEIQTSLDNALDIYYADLAEKNELTIIDSNSNNININHKIIDTELDSIFEKMQQEYKTIIGKDITGFTQIIGSDSAFTFSGSDSKSKNVKVIVGKKEKDSLKLRQDISAIYISILNDSLNFSNLNSILKK